jgi:5-methylcytosine-specific restriction enzyme subunit McrC
MLSYAFEVLKKDSYKKLETEDFENAADLFAEILALGIGEQIKKGIIKDYEIRIEETSYLRGKIDISSSIKQQSMLRSKMVCVYDEFTENTYLNQILKTTMNLLIRNPDVEAKQKQSLKKLIPYFSKIDEIDPYKIQWSRLTYHRNNATYEMLLNICYLIINGLLMTEEKGTKKLAKYLDDQHMSKLFEKFVLNYYRKQYPKLHPSSTIIKWYTDNEDTEFLPIMKTDVMLKGGERILIIDTKYYSKTMQINRLYNTKTIHSHNMYQIYAYVKNADKTNSGNVSGLLLYAKTDEDIDLNKDYIIGGNRISVKTLDLNTDFREIEKQLNKIVEELELLKNR